MIQNSKYNTELQKQKQNRIINSMEILKSPKRAVQMISQPNITTINQRVTKKLVTNYSTSQDYFYKQYINSLIQKKYGDQSCIKVNDIKFDQGKQYMEKYYSRTQSCQQLPQLFQYYKYYTQDSICFNNREFGFLAIYHQKKKAILYEILKKQLNISDSQESINEMTSVNKIPQQFDNVLSGQQLTTNKNDDQSYLLNQMLKNLVNHYGTSNIKSLNKIDCQFKFMTHSLPNHKQRNSGLKQNGSGINLKTMMQSTNTSMRNNVCMNKKNNKNIYHTNNNNNNNNSNNTNKIHRRFRSCEVPKSAKSSFGNSINNGKIKERESKDKRNKIKKTKYGDNVITYNCNSKLSNLQSYQKQSLKTEEEGNGNKNNNNFIDHQFRDKIQLLRNKIRKEKENFYKKPIMSTGNKKKLKKL